ncbi:vWA domain-containing protein [Massilibacterium senegalense]|uniref:vWA domain-containing protein n=1 Tax=Massilibacterium senegalense TaxID=1632858 RepID=UPI0007851517|nr:VWA domain-containing protein [Massilibacterium senegalense]
MHKGVIKQILLLTDGCSNRGEDPVAMAALAYQQGITVNVIGIIQKNHMESRAAEEIAQIAEAGGGVCQVVYTNELPQTVQMVTRQAMTQTIQGVVNRELKNILETNDTLETLSPEKRMKVMEVVDDLSETLDLEICILVDASASMTKKLAKVKEALVDLSISLSSRMGNHRFSLTIFPGKRSDTEEIFSWTDDAKKIENWFQKLVPQGLTPTGPALKHALLQFSSLKRWADDEYIEEQGW